MVMKKTFGSDANTFAPGVDLTDPSLFFENEDDFASVNNGVCLLMARKQTKQ